MHLSGSLRSLPSSKNKRGERNFICQSHVIGEQIDISKAGQRNSNEKATCSDAILHSRSYQLIYKMKYNNRLEEKHQSCESTVWQSVFIIMLFVLWKQAAEL